MSSPLRIAVNLRPLRPGRIGGLENAFRGTVEAMLRRFAERVELTLFTLPDSHDTLAEHPSIVRRVPAPGDRKDRIFAKELPEHDVLWCPFMFLDPEDPPIPAAVLIPDLQHEVFPEFFSKQELATRLRQLRITVQRAARLLTISEFSREHIEQTYGLADSDRVVVTPLDCGAVFRAPADPQRSARLIAELGLPESYCLFPANAWPHKNHRTVFRALAHYREHFGAPPHLVLTGVSDMGQTQLAAEISAAGVEDLVHHVGFVARDDMPALYDGAAALVFVSLFEGFGIPLVEAMRRGTPVIAADTTSVPEVVGDCGLLVPPTDPVAVAQALRSIFEDPDAARARAERGRQRAERFAYDVAAERTLEAFAAMAAQRSVPARVRDPKVFVVTPSFNQGRFLRATIESVLSQDYANLDYFVADGGSTDESVDILRSYGDRVRWVSEPDGGQAAAINKAWRDTDADIVAWLNSDDVYLEGAVRKGVAHLQAHPEVAMVYGRAWYTDEPGEFTDPYPIREPFDRGALAGECYICQPATFLRREVFKVIALPDPELRFAMDYDLWIRLSLYFGVGFVDDYLATSRMYEDNKTLGQRDGCYREIIEVAKRHFGSVHSQWLRGYDSYKLQKKLRKLLWFMPERVMLQAHTLLQSYRQRRLPAPPYDDGWVGQRTHVQVEPDESGCVAIHGDSPTWPFFRPLRIDVRCDGEIIASRTIRSRGPFTFEFEVKHRRLAPAQLIIEANRAFIPALRGMSRDPRSLSFRIRRVVAGVAERVG